MQRRDVVVAIDGPSGSGKSTVARAVARQLGLRYLDTGAMYRAVTWLALRDRVPLDDASALGDLARRAELVLSGDPGDVTVRIDGVDVTRAVRAADVTAAVSAVSAVPAVRAAMLDRQRQAIDAGGVVAEGRDIGTTVAPDAPVKVFLTATPEARAGRRAAQDADPVTVARPALLERTVEELRRRDQADTARAASPLARADDAIEIDSTRLDVEAVVALICDRVRTVEVAAT